MLNLKNDNIVKPKQFTSMVPVILPSKVNSISEMRSSLKVDRFGAKPEPQNRDQPQQITGKSTAEIMPSDGLIQSGTVQGYSGLSDTRSQVHL